jgi:predicted Zn-dependent peptidase
MKIDQTTLDNGLRIVTASLADARSVTVNVVAGTGSRYEEYKKNGGVSHFLEHLLFKGSKKYPSAQAIAEAVDAVGGYNNAYTTEDVTAFYIKVPARHGALALDILCDMVMSPLLDPNEIDRERGVIIEEMNVFRDDPSRFIGTLVPALIFPDNPLGRDIIGS